MIIVLFFFNTFYTSNQINKVCNFYGGSLLFQSLDLSFVNITYRTRILGQSRLTDRIIAVARAQLLRTTVGSSRIEAASPKAGNLKSHPAGNLRSRPAVLTVAPTAAKIGIKPPLRNPKNHNCKKPSPPLLLVSQIFSDKHRDRARVIRLPPKWRN